MKLISTHADVYRSLILAGGGARLSYQAGVLMALEEEGLSFNHVDGTSGGIFNTAMLSSGVEPKEMAIRWRSVNVMNFSSLLSFKSYFSKKTFAAFGDADGIINKIFPALGIDVAKMNANHSIDATFNVCNFSKKTVEVFTNKNVTLQHLVAGMSLPIFMPAIDINGDWYTDAVWIKDANITEALKRNPKEIWLVWAIGNSHEFLNGTFNQYVHMIEISANGGLLLELEQIEKINMEGENESESEGKDDVPREKIILHVIKPEFPLPLDPDLLMNKININELINCGYADAKQYLHHKNPEGVIPDYKATMMSEPGIALNFRMQFCCNIKWNDQLTRIIINVRMSFRLIDNRLVERAYGSIRFNDEETVISTYNNTVTLIRSNNMLLWKAAFLYRKQVYQFECRMKLNNLYDMLAGMEFKKAQCTITGSALNSEVKFTAIQKANFRIVNLLFTHISSNSSFIGKWKEKIAILKMIYSG